MKAQRGSRGIALLFLDLGTWMDVGGQRNAPAALPPERPGTRLGVDTTFASQKNPHFYNTLARTPNLACCQN